MAANFGGCLVNFYLPMFLPDVNLRLPSMKSASKYNSSDSFRRSFNRVNSLSREVASSQIMSPCDYKMPKDINKDVVKAANSFVVRRKDVKPADDCGLGGELKGLNSRQGCRYAASRAYMLIREVKWRMLM